jgi:ribosomal protein S12 methylthiotransferase
LARELSTLGAWVRMHYVYPYPHVDELVELMAEGGNLLPYLDIPFQHASPTVLKAMRRPAAAENTLRRIERWREMVPDLVLRSTFIVGFPGETEADFEQLMQWLEAAQLDRVGCFTYSPVEGATANVLPGAVDPEVAEQRRERFMHLQENISANRLIAKVGAEMRVLVDEVGEEGTVLARSAADAPEIDGVVYVEGAENVAVGDWLDVRITDADIHDLWAEPV